MSRRLTLLAIFALAAALVFFLLSRAGSFLVVDDPQPSDVIVVLEGSGDTPGYFRALHLHHDGYAGKVLLDANVNAKIFGKTEAEMAREYLDHIGQQSTEICPTVGRLGFCRSRRCAALSPACGRQVRNPDDLRLRDPARALRLPETAAPVSLVGGRGLHALSLCRVLLAAPRLGQDRPGGVGRFSGVEARRPMASRCGPALMQTRALRSGLQRKPNWARLVGAAEDHLRDGEVVGQGGAATKRGYRLLNGNQAHVAAVLPVARSRRIRRWRLRPR